MPIRPTREQQQFINRFRRYVSDDGTIHDVEFSNSVEELRKSKVDILEPTYKNVEIFEDGSANADEILSPIHLFMTKYEFPLIMEEFVYHFIKHNDIDLTKLRYGVYLVDDRAMEASGDSEDITQNYHTYLTDSDHNRYVRITLAVPINATTTQITHTISQHKQFIKVRQARANNDTPIPRVRSEFYAERDREILGLYEQGLRPREIERRLSDRFGILTAPMISNIVSRRRRQQR